MAARPPRPAPTKLNVSSHPLIILANSSGSQWEIEAIPRSSALRRCIRPRNYLPGVFRATPAFGNRTKALPGHGRRTSREGCGMRGAELGSAAHM